MPSFNLTAPKIIPSMIFDQTLQKSFYLLFNNCYQIRLREGLKMASNDLTIRLGETRDISNIAAFSSKMAEETEGLHLDGSTVQRGVEAVVRDPEKGFYLVAEKGNRMVGQLAIVFEWSDWSNNHFWLMQGVYVD